MSLGTPHVPLVAGDKRPRMICKFVDIDLDDYDSIQLRVRLEDGSNFTLDAVIDDADAGEFHFEWASGLAAGTHQAEIVFTAGTESETWPPDAPLDLVVRPSLGAS